MGLESDLLGLVSSLRTIITYIIKACDDAERSGYSPKKASTTFSWTEIKTLYDNSRNAKNIFTAEYNFLTSPILGILPKSSGLSQAMPGVGLAFNTIDFGLALNDLVNQFGVQKTCQALFGFLTSINLQTKSSAPAWNQSTASFKADILRELPSVNNGFQNHLNSDVFGLARWVIYKYKPSFLIQARQIVLENFGPRLISLCASILAVIVAAGSGASLGILPAVMGGIAGGVALGVGMYQLEKLLHSHCELRQVKQENQFGLSNDLLKEVRKKSSLFHRTFHMVTIGDVIRYKLGEGFQRSKNYLNYENYKTYLRKSIYENNRSGFSKIPENWNFETVLYVAMWDIIKKDAGEKKCQKALEEKDPDKQLAAIIGLLRVS